MNRSACIFANQRFPPFWIYSGVELLDHVLVLISVLWETSIYFLMYAFPLRVYKDSFFSTSPQFICRLYADRFWKGMRCYLIVVLISISLIIQGYWASCHMPVRYLYVLFGKMSAQVFSPFHGLGSLLCCCCCCCLILSWMTYLCILHIKRL